MLKLVGGEPPNQILALGLSFGNLDKFRAEPFETYIRVVREETGLPIDVILYSGGIERRKGTQQGRDVFMIGFSIDQIDFMRANPGKTLHRFDKAQYGLSMDILVFSGESEAAMTETVADLIGPETRVAVSERLKN